MEIFKKRDRWIFRDETGRLRKFATEQEAKLAAGFQPLEEKPNAEKEVKKEGSQKKTSTN